MCGFCRRGRVPAWSSAHPRSTRQVAVDETTQPSRLGPVSHGASGPVQSCQGQEHASLVVQIHRRVEHVARDAIDTANVPEDRPCIALQGDEGPRGGRPGTLGAHAEACGVGVDIYHARRRADPQGRGRQRSTVQGQAFVEMTSRFIARHREPHGKRLFEEPRFQPAQGGVGREIDVVHSLGRVGKT